MNGRRYVADGNRVIVTALFVLLLGGSTFAQWNQWGGPNRDFKADTTGLAESWPEMGPKTIWSRSLGEGNSSIVVNEGRIFTMYRSGDEEVVIALDRDSGKTVWEHRYPAAMLESIETRYGKGPHATPALHDGRVYALGVNGLLHCLDQETGKVVWSHDLVKEYSAKPPEFGFASSPIVYKKTLIASVGGKGVGMMAFDLASGKIAWKENDFENVYSSPIIIDLDGEDQVVLLTDREIVGADPNNGKVKWRREHVNQWKTNISTPVWGKDNLLYVTSGGDAGAFMLKLSREGTKTNVEEVWANRKFGIGQSNVIRIGDYLYGCAGHGRNSFLAAADAKTGEFAWKEQGFTKGQIVHADGKFIVVDDSGLVTLATAKPEAFTKRSAAKMLDKESWTVPTVVGKKLFLRDRQKIMALDIG